ncbi:hypothetical protein QW060_27740 [Myroides ceti]|uniref:NADH dehydrogenase subunit 4 n=1 Tax=Paenimyroides ceti TaxID=395087 RepID=A0ABT8D183_9FLAO|nr:hypothetical protein [Paenimyroides ceti]MDN3710578.1 hypothetical protein [Paenimyroides ceti]
MLTMLVTTFATCSARISVYVIIISLVIRDEKNHRIYWFTRIGNGHYYICTVFLLPLWVLSF